MENIVFGIDFGTAYSSISYVDKYDKTVVFQSFEGYKQTPSVVYFDKNKVIVGEEAKEFSAIEPEKVVSFIKREIGNEAEYKRPTKFPDELNPSEIAAYILKKIEKDANDCLMLPEKIKKVVLTCPAYYDSDKRKYLKLAAEIAGLEVVYMINEPTAAVIAYNNTKSDEEKFYMVYDLGSETLDVTIIRVKNSVINIIAYNSDKNLGCTNWDIALAKYLLNKFNEEHNTSYDIDFDPILKNTLLLLAEKKKKQLASLDAVKVKVDYEGKSALIEVTHDIFNGLTEHFLDATIDKTKEVLDIAKQKGFYKIDEVLLIGGGSRMPQVKTKIDKEFNFDSKLFDPEECIAKGAAIYEKNDFMERDMIEDKSERVVMCYSFVV